MFKLPETQDEKIEALIDGVVCYDGDNYIKASNGRRKAGRRKKYVVFIKPDNYFTVIAGSDTEAVEKANNKTRYKEAK